MWVCLFCFTKFKMKLPFSIVIGQVLKPHFTSTKLFCKSTTFSASIPYTYIFSTIGLFVNIHHIKAHLGEIPISADESENVNNLNRNEMLLHDLKIIATSLGLIQYACLLVGCLTENPSLFLPHLVGQMVVICVRLLNTVLFLSHLNLKMLTQLKHKLTALALMTFNWLQEFCVFRQYLCICDL